MLPAVMLTLVESKAGEKQSENDKEEKKSFDSKSTANLIMLGNI